jgi:TRAP-type C4-dicarboxylate transport system permease small subunit
MEPNPYRRSLFNIAILAFAAVFLFGLFALVASRSDSAASSFWSWWSGAAFVIGIVFIALWLVVSALRYEAPTPSEVASAAESEASAGT